MSQKAAEVDTLTDRLADEQKKAREMQWAFEKEKCKSDKKEELESEELEVRQFLDKVVDRCPSVISHVFTVVYLT